MRMWVYWSNTPPFLPPSLPPSLAGTEHVRLSGQGKVHHTELVLGEASCKEGGREGGSEGGRGGSFLFLHVVSTCLAHT